LSKIREKDREISNEGAHEGTDNYIGKEMHAYDNARHCDQSCHRQQARLALRIKAAYRQCDGERSHGVTGGKGNGLAAK